MPVQFGDFTLDDSRRQLFRAGEPVRLSPKAYQLLTILLAERPKAVSKRDLQDRLWPDTFVTEGNLTTTVAELRAALGEDRRNSRFIRTLYGFGYAFVPDAGEPKAVASRVFSRWKIASFALIAAIGVVSIVSLRSATSTRPRLPDSIKSIAVLPFDTSGADRADQHLALGLPDLLITRLTNVHELIVRPTSAIRDFAAGRIDSREAGRKLDVDAVLEGSIRTTPERIRVTVQLLSTHDQKPIWADRFDEKRADMFAIEDQISERVARALMMRLTPNEKSLLGKRYTTDAEAYQLFIEARYRQEESIRDGRLAMKSQIALLQKAVERDPSYALAWATLAEIYAGAGAFGQIPPGPAFENARAAVRKALIDDDLSEAHCAAGVIKAYGDLDYAGAESEFRRALQLSPRNTLAMMHFGRLLVCLGRFDEAIALRKLEIEIDPLNPGVQSFLASTYVTAHQDDLAIRQALLVLRMNPHHPDAHISLARVYASRGDYDKAIEHARQAMEADTERVRGLAFMGYVYGLAGKTAQANEVLQQLRHENNVQPFDLAIVHLALGHRDDVFRLLDQAFDDRTYVLRLKTEPIFEPLHSDSRFQSLLQRAGFGS